MGQRHTHLGREYHKPPTHTSKKTGHLACEENFYTET